MKLPWQATASEAELPAASHVVFDFVLEEAGWGRLIVRWPNGENQIGSISYMTEALGDLIAAGVALAFGENTSVEFDHEGCGSRLDFRWLWSKQYNVRMLILKIASTGKTLGSNDGHEAVRAKIRFDDADVPARALLAMGQGVWDRHGADGYDQLWCSGGFPNRQLAALRAALAEAPILSRRQREDLEPDTG